MTQIAFALFCLTCALGLSGAVEAETGSRASMRPVREAPPMAITSDTLDYCRSLARKVHKTLRQTVFASAPIINQAMYLEQEGEALCAHGHLRSGIADERRALAVLNRS